jgi:alpha-glucosidase (family GH31 glycosyl hydrolase)
VRAFCIETLQHNIVVAGQFENRSTYAVVNRKLFVPSFTTSISNGVLTIATTSLVLRYEIAQPFSNASLTIASKRSNMRWMYGQTQAPNNLLGTIKSLDLQNAISLNCAEIQNVTANGESLHCEYGLVSRDGWALVDDSDNYAWDNNDWWQGQNIDDVDLYFFGHDHEYVDALADYMAIGGRVAMVPRYALGVWWTR